MKQSRIIGITLAALNVILIVFCIVLYAKADRTKPVYEFQAVDVIYRENMDSSKLLEGIKAYDSNDGDVTDRIVIEKVMENKKTDTAVVFYAVSDRSGNVVKFSKEFKAVYTDSDEKSEKDTADDLLEAGIVAELNFEEGNQITEDEIPEEIPEPSITPSPTATPEATAVPEIDNEPEATPEPTPKPVPTADPSIPVLKLKVSEVKINQGEGPAWVNIIETMKDDKDNYETLFQNLSVSKYDNNKSGTYQVTVSTEDSDGNKSQAVPLTIVVK